MKFSHVSAYSFGKTFKGRLGKTDRLYTPGPGQYNPSAVFKSAPHWRIGSAARGRSQYDTVPGPGQYQFRTSIGMSPKYTISSKSGAVDMNKYIVSPGPAFYSPKPNFKSPSYSMSARPNTAKSYIFPGPGNYDIRTDKSLQVPTYKFGSEKRDGLNLSANKFSPGPGNYEPDRHDNLGRSSPKFSFGKELRGDNRRPMTPGPGHYQLKNIIGNDGPKITISNRPQTSKSGAAFMPGPGHYNSTTPSLTRPKSPAYVIGSGKRDTLYKFLEAIPGPGQYSPNGMSVSTRPKSPTWSMGTGMRPPLNVCELVPGPGQYVVGGKVGEGPKYTISGKNFFNNSKFIIPGPGQYNSDTQANLMKNPIWGFGSGTREDNIIKIKKENLPGPGMYEIKDAKNGPQYRFGNEKRGGKALGGTPGPGQYHIPCAIVDVNGYTRTSGAFDPNFKYI